MPIEAKEIPKIAGILLLLGAVSLGVVFLSNKLIDALRQTAD